MLPLSEIIGSLAQELCEDRSNQNVAIPFDHDVAKFFCQDIIEWYLDRSTDRWLQRQGGKKLGLQRQGGKKLGHGNWDHVETYVNLLVGHGK